MSYSPGGRNGPSGRDGTHGHYYSRGIEMQQTQLYQQSGGFDTHRQNSPPSTNLPVPPRATHSPRSGRHKAAGTGATIPPPMYAGSDHNESPPRTPPRFQPSSRASSPSPSRLSGFLQNNSQVQLISRQRPRLHTPDLARRSDQVHQSRMSKLVRYFQFHRVTAPWLVGLDSWRGDEGIYTRRWKVSRILFQSANPLNRALER
ncbi:uncharacterized protein K441DRAFT_128960 [Cenococcum geophilum 1.58]|uniref:uncharacterized protein n=1 Tax=Cenococcum geophilum 1.58 TaxID=794803 RepID=UPI00358DE96E|nr:hypothetical protein K441DRAFT_128960 [Cenococcum geophilum 1.58]